MDQEDQEFTIQETGVGERIDKWISSQIGAISRAKAKSMIEDGLIRVNGAEVKTKYQLATGDTITVGEVKREESHLDPISMNLDIVHEDDHLIVVNKPAGLNVHPGAGEAEATLVHGLLHHCNLSSLDGELESHLRPGIVHRIDKHTSGLLVVAKDDETHQGLAAQFQEKTNKREYLALLDGILRQKTQEITSYLYRDPRNRLKFTSMTEEEHERMNLGRREPRKGYRLARSRFTRLGTYSHNFSLVRVKLYTGRTHQIRVHSHVLKAPIVADPLYGVRRTFPNTVPDEVVKYIKTLDRQMLHAATLGFTHPITDKKMTFKAPLPADFQNLMDLLEPLVYELPDTLD